MAEDTTKQYEDDADAVPRTPENRYGFTPERLARRVAAMRQIRQFGDPVLKMPAQQVREFDKALLHQVEFMTHLMHESYSAGLAANQVGILNRVLVYNAIPGGPVITLINPVLEWVSPERETGEEGCQSLPEGLWIPVERSLSVHVRACDVDGKEFRIEAHEHEARVIQHEVDHLDGILMIDRTTREERRRAMRVIRESSREADFVNQ